MPAGTGSQDDPRVNDWVKRNASTDYTSLKWCRPVIGKPGRAYSATDRDKLLKDGFLSWEKETGVGRERRRQKHKLTLLQNIFRQSWMFFSRDDKDSDADAVIAWEERATLWCKQIDRVYLSEFLDMLWRLETCLATSSFVIIGSSSADEREHIHIRYDGTRRSLANFWMAGHD